IVFTDNSGRVKTGVGNADELLAQWNRVAERAEVVEDDSAFRHIQQVDIENGYILKKEIAPGTIRVAQGSFIISLQDKKALTPNVLQVLESLSAATALWISRDDAIVKTEIRLRNEFIWGLAKTRQMNLDANIHSRA